MQKILLVDDSKVMRRILASFFKKMGYENVAEASSVKKALVILGNQEIDLVVSDYSMPGANGLDLLRSIRTDPDLCDVMFVMVTAEAQLCQILAAFREGAQHYITKPFTYHYLEYVVKRALMS
ncbi:MAG: response regulator [Desulfobulbaceae bacterium]|nr:response regulator [Desulfobulbaceae bacterium]